MTNTFRAELEKKEIELRNVVAYVLLCLPVFICFSGHFKDVLFATESLTSMQQEAQGAVQIMASVQRKFDELLFFRVDDDSDPHEDLNGIEYYVVNISDGNSPA